MYNPQAPLPGALGAGATGGNTSGMGRASTVPPELLGWNWGAFLLNLFWGIGNNTWIALLMLVPFVNWVMPFVLGAKGNAWAWQNRRWQDIAHFRRVQRRWTVMALVLWLAMILVTAVLPVLVFKSMVQNPVHELAFTAVRTSPEATALLGVPIEKAGSAPRNFSLSEQEGRTQIRFVISGPRGSATVEAHGRKTAAGWELDRVIVLPQGGGAPLVVLPRQRL